MPVFLQIVTGASIGFLLFLAAVQARELYRSIKYRHEFFACAAAIKAGDQEQIRVLNAANIYFWVRVSGYASKQEGRLVYYDRTRIATRF